MNKIVVAQEFVRAVNPALKSSNLSSSVFSELMKTKDDAISDGKNSMEKSAAVKCTDARVIENTAVPMKSHNAHVTFQRTYKVVYLGYAVLDRRYTLPMLPWVIAEIKRYGSQNAEEIYLEVAESALKAVNIETNQVVFEHKLQSISKFAQTAQDPTCFTYMTREVVNGPCAYHVFQAIDECTVLELFKALREMTKEMVQLQSVLSPMTKCGTSIALDEIMTSGQQYEVMYLGRIKVSSKRAPPTFIDDAVEKFRVYEMEKLRCQKSGGTPSYRHRHGSGASVSSLPYNLELNEQTKENEHSLHDKCSTPINRECSRISTEDLNTEGSEANPALPKSSSDPFNITALSPYCGSENFITGISPSISNSSLSQTLDSSGKNNTLMPPSSLITHTQSLDSPTCADIVRDLRDIKTDSLPRDRSLSSSGSFTVNYNSSKQTSLPAYRHRTGSGGSADMRRPRAFTSPAQQSQQQRNRTMLFLIGKLEICLIGMDKKQVLLSKTFNDIAHCSQGTKHLDHFGFICRETALAGSDFYAGYIFRCQTEKVVDEIMQSLRLAFKKAHQDYMHTPTQPKTPNVPRIVICEGCPMQWFHRLCSDVEGLPPEEAHCAILTKMHTLPDCDRLDIMAKCEDADVNCLQEQNEVLMMYLREFCEQRQMKHVHLNNGRCNTNDLVFLRDKSTGSSKLDNFRQKAKKSLSNSFETILKRKYREDGRDRSLTSISDNTIASLVTLKDDEQLETPHREGSYDGTESAKSPSLQHRPRSSTFSTTHEVRKASKKNSIHSKNSSPQAKSPIMNIFMKIGSQGQTPCTSEDESESPSKKGSWRQAIFHRVQTPVQTPNKAGSCVKISSSDMSSCENLTEVPKKKTREQLRALWKKAILEEILLIRMEKENKKLQVSQDAVSHKRMKLDYEDITPCLKDSVLMWDELLNHPDRPHHLVDKEHLQQLVKTGVPRNKRGEIWQFLAEQHKLRNSASLTNFEQLDVPYEELLRQLTSHQHAILIDLGRTFPNHPFYAQPLGPGQLSLFNLLKAYSLLDGEVGYCQGLSFVSGILLLHMPEEQAFQMMKHILFHLGFRRQYKPDMVALQIQMYQLSRLIHDSHRDLYDHLEKYDIAPTLYAAPWFLTLFASQFPLGFVSRLFDLIFLQGVETIFKVALVLLRNQKDSILQCHGFEAIMEFLKSTLPSMNMIELQRVFNQVFSLDISQQLHAYEVEYHVLKEEMMYSPSRGDTELVQKLETANRNLKVQNMELMEQLQVAYSTIHNLQASESSYKSTVQRLEARIRSLEDEKEVLTHSLTVLRNRLQKLEMAAAACDGDGAGDAGHTPSFQVVYALAGTEKQEDQQLKQLIRDFCERRDSEQLSDTGYCDGIKTKQNEKDSITITVSGPDGNVGCGGSETEMIGDSTDLISWTDADCDVLHKKDLNDDLIPYIADSNAKSRNADGAAQQIAQNL